MIFHTQNGLVNVFVKKGIKKSMKKVVYCVIILVKLAHKLQLMIAQHVRILEYLTNKQEHVIVLVDISMMVRVELVSFAIILAKNALGILILLVLNVMKIKMVDKLME